MIRRHFLAGVVGLKAMCAAAALAVGVGQAEAATIVSYDISMRYEGTSYSDLTVIDYGTDGKDWQYYHFEQLVAEETSIPLPTLRPGLTIGTEVTFKAALKVPTNPYDYETWPDYMGFDNGGRAIHCEIAGVDCVSGVTATFPTGQILFGEYRSMNFGDEPGQRFDYTFNEDYWSSVSLDWGSLSFFNRTATFTILSYSSTVQPAAVPLPTTVALMPLGLGALAMMRRRRKA